MHTRRSFLAGIAAVAAPRSFPAGMAAAAAPRSFPAGMAAAAAPGAVWKTAIGLNGFGSSERVFGKRYELAAILKFARDDGFDGVEWRPFHGPYPDPADETAIRALRSQAKSFGLRIFSIQTSPRGANPVGADPGVRQKYTELLKGQIDLAKKLGCEAAGVWPPPPAAARIIQMALKLNFRWIGAT
jgi:hypothetical protein